MDDEKVEVVRNIDELKRFIDQNADKDTIVRVYVDVSADEAREGSNGQGI